MRNLNLTLVLAVSVVIMACGMPEKESDSKSDEVEVGADVNFSGYVQRAFEIRVNDKTFADTENFYTNFVSELIMSKAEYAERFKDATIEVEGEYGLERFGSNAPIFMSSMASDGHVFQARTNNEGKFTIKVTKNAQDETFKARIIVRIGLKITEGETADRYCYLLYGFRDGISINEHTKPVIFDDYKTQLNSYNCSSVTESELIIPNNKSIDEFTPVDDVSLNEEDGNVTASPYLQLKQTIKIASALQDFEDGTNGIEAVTYDQAGGVLYVVKPTVRDTGDGSEHKPVVTLTNLASPSVTHSKAPKSIGPYSSTYSVRSIVSLGSEWLVQNQIGLYKASGDWATFDDVDTTIQTGFLVKVSDSYKHLYDNRWCDLDLNAATVEKNCKDLPSSNPHQRNGSIVHAFVRSGLIHIVYNGGQIIKYNANGVSQGEYSIPKVQINHDYLKVGHVFFDGTDLNVVALADNELVIRRLEFVE